MATFQLHVMDFCIYYYLLLQRQAVTRLSTPCNGFLGIGLGGLVMVLIFQLHVMDSRHARALLRGGPVLSTPCNGFGSLWIAWTQGAIFFQLHVMDSMPDLTIVNEETLAFNSM